MEIARQRIKPTNDYAFKKIFGNIGSESIALDFINAATEMNFDKIELNVNPNLESDVIEGKSGVTDIKAKVESLNDTSNIDLEMQVAKEKDIADRILFYWAKMYTDSIEAGESYKKSRKAICVLIADFDLDNLMFLDEYVTRWHVREDRYKDVILTEKLYLVIIELKKLKEKSDLTNTEKTLLNWCKFLISPENLEETIMTENENIKKAKEKLDEINSNEQEYWAAVARQKELIRQANIRRDAIEEGMKEGLKKGANISKKEIAKKLLDKDMLADEIADITGLTVEEINKLK